jgi:3-oxoadipate CoA-transferase alpha subunit
MIDKIVPSAQAALADLPDGATVMISGFGNAGMPSELIDALIAQGARELTIVNNNAGNGDTGLAALIKAKRVRRILCSFPRQADSWHFDAAYRAGEIELELVPQGTSASAPPARASARSSRRRRMARASRKARRRAASAAGISCSSTRSTPITRW